MNVLRKRLFSFATKQNFKKKHQFVNSTLKSSAIILAAGAGTVVALDPVSDNNDIQYKVLAAVRFLR